MQFTIVGNPENRRVISFCDSVRKAGYDHPSVISYEGWLSGEVTPVLAPNTILKIDSPGEHDDVRKLLIKRGTIEKEIIADHGEIGYMRAWYAGYCSWLNEMSKLMQSQSSVSAMNDPADIALQFNKPLCQEHLQQQGIAVPQRLPAFANYDELISHMRHSAFNRVFLKPAHASSGSGVIAFRKSRDRVQAISSVEIVSENGGIRLFNSLNIRTYSNDRQIATLVNRMIRENIFAEEWIPKASFNGRTFDIRVVVIDGEARHTVIRTSNSVITNLHLGNSRGDLSEFLSQAGEEKWASIKKLAEETAACFPASFYMGIDILVSDGWRKIVVLEVNAFGDLLPGITHEGETCYEAQINAMKKKLSPAELCQALP